MRGLTLALGVTGAVAVGATAYLVTRPRTSARTIPAIFPSGSNTASSSSSSGNQSSTPGPNTGTTSSHSGVTFVPVSASPATRLAALKGTGQVVLQGLTAAQAGTLKTVVSRHGAAITGVTAGGAVIVSLTASHAAQVSLLATRFSIVVPGQTAATAAHLEYLASIGKLVGVSSTGHPIY